MASGDRELRAQLQELKNIVKRKDKQIANVVRYSDEKRRKDRTQLESLREELRSKEKVSEENAQLKLELENLREQMAEQNNHLTRQLDSVREQLRKSEGEGDIIKERNDKMAEQNTHLTSEVENLTKKVEKYEEATSEQNAQCRRAIEAVNREYAIWRLEAKMTITQKENELFELKKDYEALTSNLVKIKNGKLKARLLGCLRRIFRRRH